MEGADADMIIVRPNTPGKVPRSVSHSNLKPLENIGVASNQRGPGLAGSSSCPDLRPDHAPKLSPKWRSGRLSPKPQTRGRRKYDEFAAKQFDQKYEMRRQFAILQKDLVRASSKDAEVLLQGAKGTRGLKQFLTERFGSVAAGWRIGIDADAKGSVSNGEFGRFCLRHGLQGQMKTLWSELDPEGIGSITLSNLDPEADRILKEFYTFVQETYGTTIELWRTCLNPSKKKFITPEAFLSRIVEAKFRGDAKKTYKLLRTRKGQKDLTFHDIDPCSASALLRADPCAEALSSGQVRRIMASPTPKAPLSPVAKEHLSTKAAKPVVPLGMVRNPTLQRLSPKGTTPPQLKPLRLNLTVNHVGPSSPSMMSPSCMSPSVMSPSLMSPNSAAAMSPSLMSPTSAGGSVLRSPVSQTRNSAWRREVMVAQRIELEASRAMHNRQDVGAKTTEDFLTKLVSRFGSMLAAWQQGLDPCGVGQIGFMDFMERLRGLNFFQGDVRVLWFELKSKDNEFLSLSDLHPEAARYLDEMREMFIKRYGSLLKAWTTVLDPNSRGYTDDETFKKNCQLCGFSGDVGTLFKLLQGNGTQDKPTLHMMDFDYQSYKTLQRGDRAGVTSPDPSERQPPLEMSFYERQDNTMTQKWRKEVSNMQIENHNSQKQREREHDQGNFTLAELKDCIERNYGNFATAWRLALDPRRQGHLGKEEFIMAVRENVGFTGDLNALWRETAKPGAPYVTLHDLDPESADLLWKCREFLLTKFGNVLAAFQALDVKQSRRIEEDDWVFQLYQNGFQGDARYLFSLLKAGPHRTFITITDLDLAAAQALYRDDDRLITTSGSKCGSDVSPRFWPKRSSSMTSLAVSKKQDSPKPKTKTTEAMNTSPARDNHLSQWKRDLGKRQRAAVAKREVDEAAKSMDIKTIAEFRANLRGRFRTTVNAWKTMIDLDGSNHISFGVFCQAIDRMGGLNAKVKKLWNDLDQTGRGFICFEDLDPENDKLLTDFRLLVLHNEGTLSEFWYSLHDANVSKESFVQGCLDSFGEDAWQEKKLQHMYQLLLPDISQGRKHLIEEDLYTLLVNVAPLDRQEMAQVPEDDACSSPGMSVASFTSTATSRIITQKVALENETPVHSVSKLKKTLIHKFGSVYAGWVQHLDITESGRVPKGEFVQRVKAIGVNGNPHRLFKDIDVEKKGHITLKDLSPTVYYSVTTFFALIMRKCGSLAECWKVFDMGSKGYVNKEEFVAGCAILGYPGSADELFRFLRPCRERSMLFLDDLGPRARGEVRKLRSQAPKAVAKIQATLPTDATSSADTSLAPAEVTAMMKDLDLSRPWSQASTSCPAMSGGLSPTNSVVASDPATSHFT